MRVIDEILDILVDGEEHSYSEFQSKTGLSEKKVDAIARFLTAYGMVTLCTQTNKLKMTPSMVKHWSNLKTVE